MGGQANTNESKALRDTDSARLAATLAFDGPVGQVHSVSAGRSKAFAQMGIRTVRDLLTHYPRRYIDMSRTATIATAPIGEACTITAHVHEVKLKTPKPRLSLTEITLVDSTSTLIVTCFRQPWLADKLSVGERVAVSGKLEFDYGFKRMTNPFLEVIDNESEQAHGLIVPVHPASEKLPTAWMRRFETSALELCDGIDDPLPLDLRMKYRLPSRAAALRGIHFPESMADAESSRRRLAFEEVLLLELHLMRSDRQSLHDAHPFQHAIDGFSMQALKAALPFELSDEQRQARDELLRAMAADKRANHMLLGDVGTGKTVVAAFGLAAAADSGTQALMMAPTEVLARQYAGALGPLLDAARISWSLLVGSTPAQERADILARLASGELSVLFGTHALLEPDVAPRACTFVVIDEQQRFGVDQRAALVAKGDGADVLSMTATPIPRSLALALYGNMTLSYIKHRPMTRAATQTAVFSRDRRGEAYDVVREALAAGQQAYVVCPLVESSANAKGDASKKKSANAPSPEDEYAFSNITIEAEGDIEGSDAKAAVDYAAFLRDKVFFGYQVGVLHGRMKSDQKQQVMHKFRNGEIDVLVATTVIEVGVDVPNATAMIIEDADRFGLAQLHQLRGRVGRGGIAGRVCLISSSKAPVALDRLSAMESTEDGFELAEYDLSLRREGDILGNRQHGASVLKLVNVVRDAKIIEAAHGDADAIMQVDPNLESEKNRALRYELARTFEA